MAPNGRGVEVPGEEQPIPSRPNNQRSCNNEEASRDTQRSGTGDLPKPFVVVSSEVHSWRWMFASCIVSLCGWRQ